MWHKVLWIIILGVLKRLYAEYDLMKADRELPDPLLA